MAEETIHESAETRSRQGIAAFLRRVARRLRRGEPVPVDDEGTVAVDPPAETELEVELEREDGEVSLEVELAWPADEGAVDTDADESKATFEVYEDSAGEHRWRLRHDNGNIIADSGEGYTTKASAEQDLESVKQNAPDAAVTAESSNETVESTKGGSKATFEMYEDSAREHRWRLRHNNSNIIADSGEGYASKQGAKNGLQSVKTNAPGAGVEHE
jgi:amphi-Trp domain-containing protein